MSDLRPIPINGPRVRSVTIATDQETVVRVPTSQDDPGPVLMSALVSLRELPLCRPERCDVHAGPRTARMLAARASQDETPITLHATYSHGRWHALEPRPTTDTRRS